MTTRKNKYARRSRSGGAECRAGHVGLRILLGVARHTLSRVLNGHAAISPEMAIRLEKAGWSNAEFWLRRQTTFNLVQARSSEGRIKVKRYQPQTV